MAKLDWERSRRQRPRLIDQELWTGQKSMPTDHHRPISADAIEAFEYAQNYDGAIQFMVEMRALARSGRWWPTKKQTKAILRCRTSDIPRRARSGESAASD